MLRKTASMVVIESIQANLIPIACYHGGMKEMINTAGFGLLFKDDDFEMLAEKMLLSYYEYSEQTANLKLLKSSDLEEFGSQKCYKSLMDLY
jgi:glycosyltransferase involved in cell wall biosynthesis